MEFILNQVFMEIRYQEMIDITENMGKLQNLQKTLSNTFTNAQFDFSNNAFIMENGVKKIFCHIQPNRILISSINTTSEIFAILASEILKEIKELQLFGKRLRVGIRYNYTKETDNMEQAEQLINNKFLIIDTIKRITDCFSSPGVKFTSEREDFKVNYNISPGMSNTVQFDTASGAIVSKTEKTVMVIDLDYYIDNIDGVDLNIIGFIQNIAKVNIEDLEKVNGVLEG